MKKYIPFIALSLALASCSSHDDVKPVAEGSFTLSYRLNANGSRSTSTNLQTSQIVNGRDLGVFILDGSDAFYSNVKVTSDGNGNLNSSEAFLWGSHKSANVVSYHPYNAQWTLNDDQVFTISADQTTPEGYLDNDLLHGTCSSTQVVNNVEIAYVHKLAKVVITISPSANVDTEGASISLTGGIKPNFTFNVATGALGVPYGDEITIAMGQISSSDNSVAAIIAPQTLEQGNQMVVLQTTDGKKYAYSLPEDYLFGANTENKFTFTFTGEALTLVGTSISPWETNETQGVLSEVNNSTPATDPEITWASCGDANQWTDGTDRKLAVGAYVYAAGLTCDQEGNGNDGANSSQISAELGVSTDADLNSGNWTWNGIWFNCQSGGNYFYYGNSDAVTVGETYYYTVRFKIGDEGEWFYADADNLKSVTITAE